MSQFAYMISDLEIVQTLMYFLFVRFKLSASRFKLDLESQISNAVSNFWTPLYVQLWRWGLREI